MADIFEYINLDQHQKSKKDGIVEGILAAIAGHLLLQDHGSIIHYRNIKIR